jgi:hypothetical protein
VKGIALEDYKKNITEIVNKAQAADVKVVILTSTMIREDQSTPENQKLVAYNEFLRDLAREKKCLLADLNAEMQSALAEASKSQPNPGKGNVLTTDGVHMAFAGNQMMAIGVLKGIGLNAAELTKGTSTWLDIPDTSNVSAKLGITQRQRQQLKKLADARKIGVNTLIQEEFNKLVTSLANPKP